MVILDHVRVMDRGLQLRLGGGITILQVGGYVLSDIYIFYSNKFATAALAEVCAALSAILVLFYWLPSGVIAPCGLRGCKNRPLYLLSGCRKR